MFYTQDYPEWVSKFELGLRYTDFNECIVEDDEVWELARESREIPHVANIWISELFHRIENHLNETYGEGVFEVEYYANGMGSSLSINKKEIMTYDDLQGVIDKKKLNEDEVDDFDVHLNNYLEETK